MAAIMYAAPPTGASMGTTYASGPMTTPAYVGQAYGSQPVRTTMMPTTTAMPTAVAPAQYVNASQGQRLSYVAPPGQAQAMPPQPQAIQAPSGTGFSPTKFAPGAPPHLPAKLTDGMIDPGNIDRQKQHFASSLEDQLGQGIKLLEQQNQMQKQQYRQEADQKKHQYAAQVDAQLQQQEMSTDQQANYQLMNLQQAAHEQKTVLEQQAHDHVVQYQQKQVQDDFAQQQYEYQRKAYGKQVDLQKELQADMAQHANQGMPDGPPPEPDPRQGQQQRGLPTGQAPQQQQRSYVPPTQSSLPPGPVPQMGSNYSLPPPPPPQPQQLSQYSNYASPPTAYTIPGTQYGGGFPSQGSNYMPVANANAYMGRPQSPPTSYAMGGYQY